MKDASMSLGIYFEIKDAELYGGEGTTGYAATIVEISIEGLQNADFERYPKYKQAYIRAFDKMLEVREAKGLKKMRGWEDGKSVFRWWIDEKWNPDQMEIKDWLYEIGAITAEQYDDEHFIY